MSRACQRDPHRQTAALINAATARARSLSATLNAGRDGNQSATSQPRNKTAAGKCKHTQSSATTLPCLIFFSPPPPRLFCVTLKSISCPLESYLFVYSSGSSLAGSLIMNKLLVFSLIHVLLVVFFLALHQ